MIEDSREYREFLYHTPGAWERDGQLWTIRAGHSITRPGYVTGPRRIECFSLHLIVTGELELLDDGQSIELKEGDVFCLFPGRTYTYKRPESCPDLRLRWIAFDGGAAASMLEEAGLTDSVPYKRQCLTPAIMSIMDQQFHLLRKEGSSFTTPRETLLLQSLLLQLFAALMEDMRKSIRPLPLWVEQSVAYIELHATEGLTVDRLAEMAGLHRNYYSTAFSESTGKSPQQYITEVRMGKAAGWLLEPGTTVTEIAYSLGYANPYSFTRAFIRYYGMPPTAYRELKKE